MSSRKPPSNSGDFDDFDIPKWDDTAGSAQGRVAPQPSSSTRRTRSGRDAYPDPLYDDYDAPGSPSRPPSQYAPSGQQPPRLSNRVPTRTTRPSQRDPYRDPYSGAEETFVEEQYYDPAYDAPQQRASAASQYDLYAEPAVEADWGGAAVYDEELSPRRRPRQRTRAARPNVSIARPAISDTGIAAIVGAAVVSLLVMIGAVWYGMGDLADVIPWHVNASGDVDRWVSSSTLWRIPFGSFMALAIGSVLGFFLWKRDRFAARFIISSMCVIQVLAWVAVIDQLW
ncbi:MAG TPA: hypothetical protein VFP05_07040 [Thermomicrobiales bacterium]|nr:hypothetical protein [Thermomicrobiales bacterium]